MLQARVAWRDIRGMNVRIRRVKVGLRQEDITLRGDGRHRRDECCDERAALP